MDDTGVTLAFDADSGDPLLVTDTMGRLCLCIFDDRQEAEECLQSWDLDERDWNIVTALSLEGSIELLERQVRDLEFVTLSPPRAPGESFSVYDLALLVEQLELLAAGG